MVPAADGTHHLLDGASAYPQRFLRVFGFYEGLAAVQAPVGWFHILPDGHPAYPSCFEWVGNYQQSLCVVRSSEGLYFHIGRDGTPAYKERYLYVGDFREGAAVAQRNDRLATHIDVTGGLLHGHWFLDVGVFHKGFARARDTGGWHHINRVGQAAYSDRFEALDDFYNGQSWAKSFSGEQLIITEYGDIVRSLR